MYFIAAGCPMMRKILNYINGLDEEKSFEGIAQGYIIVAVNLKS